ncbi:unnamed protein product [Diplocarpon coronariae]|uniref:Uncharacterized protein n=1 Tax=Diplocarpon coronariae TaxID=2795749 RepID=A0A218YVV7_9HELO|nr:hypothetical protein B2J93_6852 [Marssonina coronariae]
MNIRLISILATLDFAWKIPGPNITLYFLQASLSIRVARLLEELQPPYESIFYARENSKAPVPKDGTMSIKESGATISRGTTTNVSWLALRTPVAPARQPAFAATRAAMPDPIIARLHLIPRAASALYRP